MFEGRFPLIVTSPSAPWRTPIRIYQPMNALETASKTRRFLSLLWNDGVKNYGETSSVIWKAKIFFTLLSGFNFQPLWKIGKSVGMIIPNIWNNNKCLKPPIRTCFNDRRSWSHAGKKPGEIDGWFSRLGPHQSSGWTRISLKRPYSRHSHNTIYRDSSIQEAKYW